MRTITCIVAPFTLAALACNSPTTGDQGALTFTPTRCGNPLLGCDFASGLATGAAIDVQVHAVDGSPIDGLVLESSANLTIEDVADPDGIPTWSVTATTPGSGMLRGVDAQGGVLDALGFAVHDAERLGFHKLVGTATGPATEAGVDEAWTVPAGQLVSFQVVPFAGEDRLMGRLRYGMTGNLELLATLQSGADTASGYLYVQPPAGDHQVIFDNGTLTLSARLHAN
jgi:hypothetical protein